MMYTLNASGQTDGNGAITQLWPAGSDGTKLFIQNRSHADLEVLVTLDDDTILTIDLPGSAQESGNTTNHTVVDPTLAVAVRSGPAGAVFTAVRIA